MLLLVSTVKDSSHFVVKVSVCILTDYWSAEHIQHRAQTMQVNAWQHASTAVIIINASSTLQS